MAETLRTDTDRTLLTRREIRKFFRVNELTIDRWVDRGKLMQVGEIPGEADSPTKAVFAVLDDKLIQKLHTRFESMNPGELDADRLPRETRDELAELAADKPEEAPGRRAKSKARSQVNSKSTSTGRARTNTKKKKQKPAKRPAVEECQDVPTEDGPSPDEQGPFATLQTAAEASAYPELAEALWDEETLGVLHDAAETLSAEAERLSKQEQAAAEPPQLAVESDESTGELPRQETSNDGAMAEATDGLGQLMAEAATGAMDIASRELETAGIDLEEEEDRGPQVIDEEQGLQTWSVSGGDDTAKERLLLQAELAEVKSLQQANLERMEARLANIENLVEELGLGRAQDLNIEATLDEIRGNVVVNQSRRDILAASMSMISENVQDLLTYVSAANKTALATAKRVQQLSEKLARRSTIHSSGRSSTSGHPKVAPVLVLGVGILVLTWTLAFYLKTGNFYVALAGVVLANFSACATIFLGRTESE